MSSFPPPPSFLGCLGKYLKSHVMDGGLSRIFFYTQLNLICCSQIHRRKIYYSNKNAIFTISRNDHDSRRRRHGAFYSCFTFVFVFAEQFLCERVLCLWILSSSSSIGFTFICSRWIKNKFPQQTALQLSL